MKISNLFIGIAFFLSFLFDQKIYGQCKPCTIPSKPVEPADAVQYRKNFKNNYRTSRENKKTHSVSVDFSKESIIAFYDKVFISDAAKGYKGINISFISYGTKFLPRQRHKDQIGLMISATDDKCKPDPNEFNIYNNSFNQSKRRHDYTPTTNYCGSSEYTIYKKNYYDIFSKADSKNYTLHVHYDVRVMKVLYDFLKSKPSFTGFRFSLGSYNKPKEACGQISDTQIILLITPVSSDGNADDKTFFGYLTANYAESELKILLTTLNHGELCPDVCQ